MIKNILIAIVLLGFAWAWEPTRVRMVLAARPALERMGPLGDWAVTPIQRYNTQTEISFITDQIIQSKTEGREVPNARTLQSWLQARVVTKNRGRDPWGHPYYLIQVGTVLTVGSVGEDGERGTDDDIKKSITL
ncbi:MAG TPA: type II secretion system protein GspG [Longimicrobiales bacterium]|nr:type II secretion system protein GspG [Longimicrobiales bacterium]